MTMRSRGFTLIELAIAVFVTAVMLTIANAAIQQAVDNHSTLREQQARLLEVQTAMRVIAQDFGQLAPRPVREPVGDGWQPALRSGTSSENSSSTLPLVVFTRAGWSNPAGIQRPALQRVAYVLDGDTLRRDHWPVLDATLGTQAVSRKLVSKVRSVRIRYMDITRRWQEQWPATGVVPGNQEGLLRIRPIAVEVTLELEDWGKIVRVIEVPA